MSTLKRQRRDAGVFSVLLVVILIYGTCYFVAGKIPDPCSDPHSFPKDRAEILRNSKRVLNGADLRAASHRYLAQFHTCKKQLRPTSEESKVNISKLPKLIIYWTEFFTHKDFMFGFGREPFKNAKCEVDNCVTSMDRSLKAEADAVIFHMRDVNYYDYMVSDDMDLPFCRSANQRYVYLLMEHPYNQWHDLKRFAGFFNLTMTYRLDSDIPLRYGRSAPLKEQLDEDWQIERKKQRRDNRKMIAWFVSNCKTYSEREKYVGELQEYLPVDIFGKCGRRQCPDINSGADKRQASSCYDMLEKGYKFYLSFENIYCKDYVTEKLYNILNRNIVPIVMGGADYSQAAPPHSVINVADFHSPRKLADYLIHLSKTPKEYWAYKDWRKTHQVVDGHQAWLEGFCHLCKVLNDPDYPNQVYHDIHTWWGKDTHCDARC